MERVIAIFLSCVLLSASDLLASSAEETYQAALTQEKGEGNLEEAIRLYQQVIEAHEKGEADESMAARAQLRIGVCQEKQGLAQARQTYEAVRDKYPDQPQVGEEAARRLGSTHQREAVIEEPSHRTDSESDIHALQRQIMERARRQTELTERQMGAVQRQLTELTRQGMEQAKQIMEKVKRQTEQAKRGTGADSVFIDEQVRRQLEALRQQMKQVERQMKQAKQQIDWQNQSIHGPPLHDDLLEHWSSLGTDRKAAIKKFLRRATDRNLVAEVPIKWKFHLDEPRMNPQHGHEYEYAAVDFDDSEWADIEIGRTWAEQGYADYEGGACYRAKFMVAADRVRPLHIYLEGKYRTIEVYVNGRFAAFFGNFNITESPFIVDIGPMAARGGENIVALYVYGGTDMASIDRINVYQPIVNSVSLGLDKGAGQQNSTYANSPPVVPYSHKKVAKVPIKWKFRLDERWLNPRLDREYAALGFDDSEWANIKIGQAWEAQGYAGYNGGAWYRTRIEVDAEKGQPVHLAFGGVDQHATVYVNGQWVGEHNKWSRPFILDISDQVMRDGENAVALYVFDGGGMGGIYGTVQVIQPTKEKNLDHYLANRSGATW